MFPYLIQLNPVGSLCRYFSYFLSSVLWLHPFHNRTW